MVYRVLTHIRGNVVAYLALFVALGGTAFAATSLPPNSVGTPQLKNGAVTGSKVARNTLTGANIAESTLGSVPLASHAANSDKLGNLPATAFVPSSDLGRIDLEHSIPAPTGPDPVSNSGTLLVRGPLTVSWTCYSGPTIPAWAASVQLASSAPGARFDASGVEMAFTGSPRPFALGTSNLSQAPEEAQVFATGKSDEQVGVVIYRDDSETITIPLVTRVTTDGSGNVTCDFGGTFTKAS